MGKTLAYLYLFSLSFGISFISIPLMKRLARRFRVLDLPGPRKVHQEPVPLLGGGAVVLSFVLAVGINFFLLLWLGKNGILGAMIPWLKGQYPLALALGHRLILILASAILIFVLGVADDMIGVGFDYRLKFIVQFALATTLTFSGVTIDAFHYWWLNRLVTVLWIVGITNAFNLLDNMDGLSSGVAILAGGIFFVVAYQQGELFIALTLAALVGAILGFYPYNFPRSSIFLGDGGSLFIGFLLGVLTVVESYVTSHTPTIFPVVLPLLVLSLPLFDTFSVICIRFCEKRPLFVGDKSHLSHRLVTLGLTQRQAVLCVYLFTLILGINALLLEQLTTTGCLIVLGQGFLIITLISIFMVVGARKGRD